MTADTEIVAKAARFKEWAESDGLYDFLDMLKAEYVDQLSALPADRSDALIAFKHAIRTVDIVKQHIATTVASGKVSMKSMKDLEKIKSGSKKRFW